MREKCQRRWFALIAAVTLACHTWTEAAHTSATWTTDSIGNWSNPALWSTDPAFPNNSGEDTFDAIIDSLDAAVTLDMPVTLNDFVLSAGSLLGDQTLTLTGTASWLGGNLNGTGTINLGGALHIGGFPRGFAAFTINAGSLTTTTWDAGSIDSVDPPEGGTFNNAGTFLSQTDDGWYWIATQSPVFNNTGVFRKEAGEFGFDQEFWPAFNNSGWTDVISGGIWFAGGGDHTGSFTVAADARLLVSDFNEGFGFAGAPTTTFSSSSIIASDGAVFFSNNSGSAHTVFAGTYDSVFTEINPGPLGTVHFTSGASVNTNVQGDLLVLGGSVHLDTGQPGGVGFVNGELIGGEIAGADNLFFTAFTWTGGSISGPDTASDITSAVWSLSDINPKTLSNRNLYVGVNGSFVISDGDLAMVSSRISLLANAEMDIAGDVVIFNDDSDDSASALTSVGTLRKSAGLGVAELSGVALYNDGTVQVQSGTLRLGGGGISTGAFEIADGARLDFDNALVNLTATQHELDDATTITGGAGSRLTFMGIGTTSFAGVGTVAELHFDGGVVMITGTLNAVTGAMSTEPDQTVDITIDGADAEVHYDGVAQIGANGTATVRVLNGARLASTDGFLARFAGATGAATISGASNGTPARWNLTGSLYVGGNETAAAPDGAATLTIQTGGSVAAPVATRVWNNGRINYNGGTFIAGALTLSGGGDLILSPGNDKVLQTTSIATDSANGSRLDLADNKAVVDYTGDSPIDSIRQQIRSAHNNGAWTGGGITTSSAGAIPGTGLGYGQSGVLNLTSFGGVPVDSTTILIRYTYYGDSDLDGDVDVADLGNLASNWQSAAVWTGGDFDYSGFVDVADLGLLASNWQRGVGNPLGPTAEPWGFAEALSALGLPTIAVPEPAGIGLLLTAAVMLCRRRPRAASQLTKGQMTAMRGPLCR